MTTKIEGCEFALFDKLRLKYLWQAYYCKDRLKPNLSVYVINFKTVYLSL